MEADEHADCGLGSDLKVLRASARVVLRSTMERLLSPQAAGKKAALRGSTAARVLTLFPWLNLRLCCVYFQFSLCSIIFLS